MSMSETEQMQLRESIAKLGTIQMDEEEKIRVNNPIYDITLIDPEYQKIANHFKSLSEIKENYKNSIFEDLPKSPKNVTGLKSFRMKSKIDPSFRESKEYTIFSKIAEEKIKKKGSYTNPNTRQRTDGHFTGLNKERFNSDYGVNFNQSYQYYQDDTM